MLFYIAAIWGLVTVIDMSVNHRKFAEAALWPARTAVKVLTWIVKMLSFVATAVPGWKESIDRFIVELEKWAQKLREIRDAAKAKDPNRPPP